MKWLGGIFLPYPPSDDRVPALATIRVRTLVLVDIKPSAGILVAAGRRSSAAVPAAVDDPSGAATPLVALPNVVSLSGWRRPPLAPTLPLSLLGALSASGPSA